MVKNQPIRVRMAPSPTGYFHIGSARTALFNWLFAKKNGGTFVLRIEDTDTERSSPEYEADIIAGLEWLGLDYQEGPIRQSERSERYGEYLQRLLSEHKAYYCFCSKEELEQVRQSQIAAGKAPIYSGKCRSLTSEQIEERKALGEEGVIRFKMPGGKLSFTDMIRGEISFDASLIGDFVIAKDIGSALYNFVVVVDDAEMAISHVIRGEDHINNTPKQVALLESLGFKRPLYAHIPLILNPDRSKMSKRTGGATVREYREQGYLPEALVNFLALLGWHPKDDREILTQGEIIGLFEIADIQKGGAIFNIEKLNWLNNYYIRQLSDAALVDLLVAGQHVPPEWANDRGLLERAAALVKERLVKLADFKNESSFFFELPPYHPNLLIWKKSDALGAEQNLQAAREAITSGADLMALAEERGRGELLWPLRVALSGLERSPGPLEILAVLGKDEALSRVDSALDKLAALTNPDTFSR